jgi:hypothetical protein
MIIDDFILKMLRSGTRPLITLMLVTGFIGASVAVFFGASIEEATFATSTLGAPAGITLTWWFRSRDDAAKAPPPPLPAPTPEPVAPLLP